MEHINASLKPFENIIHDIKMPLALMYTKIQELENTGDFSSEDKESLNSVKRNWFRVMKLLNDLNCCKEINAGKIKPKYLNADIVSSIEEIVFNTKSLAKKKNIEIEFKSDFDKKICAIDKEIVERILLNLISNSIKYTPAKTIITVKLLNVNLNCIKIVVEDNGTGIDENILNSIFKREIKTFDVNKRPQGSGIGLNIVKELSSLINGKLSLVSNDKGTKVSLELPVFLTDNIPEKSFIDDFYSYNIFEIELSDDYAEYKVN